jgi:hypothetical protein
VTLVLDVSRGAAVAESRHGDFGHFWPEVPESLHIGACPRTFTLDGGCGGGSTAAYLLLTRLVISPY